MTTPSLSKSYFGLACFKPKFFQRCFNNSEFFLLVASCIALVQGTIANGFLKVVVTSVEKRFKIKSYESGIITSCYEFACFASLLPVSYFGGKGNKPMWMGMGLIIQAVGVFLYILPHFISDYQQLNQGEDDNLFNQTLCLAKSTKDFRDDNCSDEPSTSSFKYLFAAGQLLAGLGETPMTILVVIYFDLNIPSNKYALYVGIYFIMTLLGPLIGFVAGSRLLNLYHYSPFSSPPHIKPDDDIWIGAWWFGLLITSALLLLLSIPMLCFPNSLANIDVKQATNRASTAVNLRRDSFAVHLAKISQHPITFIGDFMSVINNLPFMLLCASAASMGVVVNGFMTFGPKYLESQFSMTSANAANVFGSICIPAAIVGLLLGSLLMSLDIWSPKKILFICGSLHLLSSFAHLVLLPGCKEKPSTSLFNTEALWMPFNECNYNCSCSSDFNPVCASDDVTYYSPCFAGCLYSTISSSSFESCKCPAMKPTNNNISATATLGACSQPCGSTIYTVGLGLLITTFGTFICFVPGLELSLRCFPPRLRALALGIQWVVIQTIGTIPGPILFGSLFDNSCLIWDVSCNLLQVSDGIPASNCLFYHHQQLSNWLLAMSLLYKVLSVLLLLAAAFTFTWVAPTGKELVKRFNLNPKEAKRESLVEALHTAALLTRFRVIDED